MDIDGDDGSAMSEDGGVMISQANTSTRTFHAEDNFAPFYHQQMENTTDTGEGLWRIPPAKIPSGWTIRSEDIRSFNDHHRACEILRNNWKLSPAECLPPALQKTTPYSLVMLNHLASLSKGFSGDVDSAHFFLLHVWQKRRGQYTQDSQTTNDLDLVRSSIKGIKGRKKGLESFIFENQAGLMLADLDEARRPLPDKAAVNAPTWVKEFSNSQARRAASMKVKLDNKKAVRQAMKNHKAQSENLSAALLGSDVRESPSRGRNNGVALDSAVDRNPTALKQANRIQNDAQVDSNISSVMNAFGMQEQGVRPSRHANKNARRVIQANNRRKEGQASTLPSEKLQLGALQPLAPYQPPQQKALPSFDMVIR